MSIVKVQVPTLFPCGPGCRRVTPGPLVVNNPSGASTPRRSPPEIRKFDIAQLDRRRPPARYTAQPESAIQPETMDADSQSIASASEKTRKRPHASVVEPESETVSSAAGTTSPRPETGNGKRRRRKLSCETCQRLKCRCDYDPVSRTCHRCKTLRHEPPFCFLLLRVNCLSAQHEA